MGFVTVLWKLDYKEPFMIKSLKKKLASLET